MDAFQNANRVVLILPKKYNKIKEPVGVRVRVKAEVPTEDGVLLSTRQRDLSAALQQECCSHKMFSSDSPVADGGGEKSPTGDKDGRKSLHLLLKTRLKFSLKWLLCLGLVFPKAV